MSTDTDNIARLAGLEREVEDLRTQLAARKTIMDKAYDQIGDIVGDLRPGSPLHIMLSEIRASLD